MNNSTFVTVTESAYDKSLRQEGNIIHLKRWKLSKFN